MSTDGRIDVAILNGTSYVGAELARLLYAHPHARVAAVTGRSAAGKRLPEVFPHLWPLDLTIAESIPAPGESPSPPVGEGLGVRDPDLILSALPHGAAAEQLLPYIDAGVPVIDISADFRLKRVEEYEAAYKTQHPAPHLLAGAAFGIPELHRDEIAGGRLVAVPGCHSTGVILALAPAFAAGLIEPAVVADTKTGLSGAGRTLALNVHFSEADENVAPYALGGHRHLPEMTQELGLLAEAPPPQITFVPHYIPMTRGILSTCYATARTTEGSPQETDVSRETLMRAYRDYYRDAPFVHVSDTPPSTKHVMGTNYCVIHPSVDNLTGRVVIASALDNLGKGAAGAAVQCMNVMFGFDETAGLKTLGLFP